MKHKLLILNVMILGLCLTLQGQNNLSVNFNKGTQTTYLLSSIRKLTFPSKGNISIIKATGAVDNYELIGVQHIRFNETSNGIIIPDYVKSSFHLYPNPVEDELNIRLTDKGSLTAKVELISLDGKVLYKSQLSGTNNEFRINISDFRQGFYFCRINNGISIETIKFIKK